MKKSIAVISAVVLLLFTAAIGGFFALYFEKETKELPQKETEVTTTDEEDVIVEVWNRLSPAVVGVTCVPQGKENTAAVGEVNVGSGVLLDSRGYLITNYHVIASAAEIYVTLSDNTQKRGEIVGTDKRTDLALLKIDGTDYPVAVLGDSDEIKVGEQAIAIGNPGGMDFAGSVTTGIISGLNRPLTTDEGLRFKLVQTDAAINPGNSGGALANKDGEVVAINTIKISEDGFEGMGFAIPANLVKEVAAALMDKGKVTRAALGVYLLGSMGREYYLDDAAAPQHGVVVSPRKDGAGASAGLQENDIIISVDENEIKDIYELQDIIFGHNVGDTVVVTVWRSGEKISLPVVLEELKEE